MEGGEHLMLASDLRCRQCKCDPASIDSLSTLPQKVFASLSNLFDAA